MTNLPMTYKTALFIGRFQPFHNGHLYSLKKSLEVAEQVVIGIGSSNELGTKSNPWSYSEREKMVRAVVSSSGYQDRVVGVVGIPDFPTDTEWVEEIKTRIEGLEQGLVVVSNNEWTLRVMKEAGYSIYESGFYNRDELEGTKIRELMRSNRSWQERVPSSVVKLISKVSN